MILADTEEGRRAALAKLLPMQRQDFAELFEIMTGLPVTIRLLAPPQSAEKSAERDMFDLTKATGSSRQRSRLEVRWR
jgi:pyruvate,orthophosphate dikinase